MPVTVAHVRCPTRRVHDVGKEHGGEHPIVGHFSLVAGEELVDQLEGLAPWFNVVVHVAAWQFDVLRARYVISDVLAPLARDHRVVGVLDDEGWHADCGKQGGSNSSSQRLEWGGVRWAGLRGG